MPVERSQATPRGPDVAEPAGPVFNAILSEYLGDCRQAMLRWCRGADQHRAILERERRNALRLRAGRALAEADGRRFSMSPLGATSVPLPEVELDVGDLRAIDDQVEHFERARLALVAIAAHARLAGMPIRTPEELVHWTLHTRDGRPLVRRLATAGLLPPAPPGAYPAAAPRRPDHAHRGERMASEPSDRENAFA